MTSLSSPTAIDRCKKTELLNTVSTQLGLNTNRSKTKIMKAKTKNNNTITLEATERDTLVHIHEQYNKKNGGTEENFKARIQKARVAFLMLRKIWRANQIKINTKMRIVNSNVKAVLLYGSETWRSTQKTLKKNTDLHQQMPAQNPTPEVDRQSMQHYTLEINQTSTHRK